MTCKILRPSRLHSRLKCEHQYTGKSHLPCQLVCCKSLTETHLCVPQKLRCTIRLIFFCLLEIIHCHLNRSCLFWAHLEGLRTILNICSAITHCNNSCLNSIQVTLKPFVFIITSVQLHIAFFLKNNMNIMIGKTRTIGTHS